MKEREMERDEGETQTEKPSIKLSTPPHPLLPLCSITAHKACNNHNPYQQIALSAGSKMLFPDKGSRGIVRTLGDYEARESHCIVV